MFKELKENQILEQISKIPKEIIDYKVLSLNTTSAKNIQSLNTSNLELDLPGPDGILTLELVEVDFKHEDYKVYMMPSGEELEFDNEIKHYRGVIKNSDNSLAAISIAKDNEFSGVIGVDNELPEFSHSVYVIAHELGHNFGALNGSILFKKNLKTYY